MTKIYVYLRTKFREVCMRPDKHTCKARLQYVDNLILQTENYVKKNDS